MRLHCTVHAQRLALEPAFCGVGVCVVRLHCTVHAQRLALEPAFCGYRIKHVSDKEIWYVSKSAQTFDL